MGEERWTPGGSGWRAWNGKSPEREFVEFVGALVALARPAAVVETGVGQGYTTRRILKHLPKASSIELFESDPDFRALLADVVRDRRAKVSELETPTTFEGIGLAVLDSRTSRRELELELWAETAPTGSIAVVHDVSPTHPDGTIHRHLAEVVAELELRPDVVGMLLPNPRGSWLARRV